MAFARKLAPFLNCGDVILLHGNVGAGKTLFARTLIQTRLGRVEDVPSPTFTLVQTYSTEDAEIWHADLYRLTSTLEIEELGLSEAFETEICLVEWPEKLGNLIPNNALSLTFEQGGSENTRIATAEWTDQRWMARIEACKP